MVAGRGRIAETGEISRPCKEDRYLLEVILGILCCSVTCETTRGRRGIVQRSFSVCKKTFYSETDSKLPAAGAGAVQSTFCFFSPFLHRAGEGGRNSQFSQLALGNVSRVVSLV